MLDSNVVIDLAKRKFSPDILPHYNDVCISIITYVEILGYDFRLDEEQEGIINDYLRSFRIVNLNLFIAEYAIAYRKRRKIKLPDALILATAKRPCAPTC